MYEAGKKIRVRHGIYPCMDDPFLELHVKNQTELEIIADIEEEKKVVVNASKNKQPVRIVIPYYQIAA